MALIIDAKNIYGDELKRNIQFATDYLSNNRMEGIENIIKHSIKFMNILNKLLINIGTKLNTVGRTTYRGVSNKAFQDTQVGEIYRVISWCRSNEACEIEEPIRQNSISGGSKIKFYIPKLCFNADKINSIGKSWVPEKQETLLPPYTAIKMKKTEMESSVMNYEVLVARDNISPAFDMKGYVLSDTDSN